MCAVDGKMLCALIGNQISRNDTDQWLSEETKCEGDKSRRSRHCIDYTIPFRRRKNIAGDRYATACYVRTATDTGTPLAGRWKQIAEGHVAEGSPKCDRYMGSTK